MPAIVVLGAQWGDEGKGKATDLLATNETIDFVVRTSGGHNAGHTIVVNGEKFATHLLPSGILTPGATCVIANGVVVSPEALFRELDALIARGVDLAPLVVSANAHVLASYHATIDKVTERFLGSAKLGTTGRGIGPTYADKINRIGIRVADLFDEELLRQKVEASLEVKNQLLAKVYNRRRSRSTRWSRSCCRTSSGCGRWSPTRRCCSTGRWTTARPCCSRVRRPRCSTSTTGRTRTSRPPTRSPVASARRRLAPPASTG